MERKSPFVWKLFWLALVIVGAVFVYNLFAQKQTLPDKMRQPLAPVRIAKTLTQDVPYFLNGLGTVLASSDVLVKSRVNGQLMRLHFKEGQHVKAGQLLAEIDPRPFQAALNEAKGKLAADEAQLANAKRDLERYTSLIQGDYVERQKYDTQRALVAQYSGAVASDKAAVETARLQLEYSRITAPASGTVGLRKVDVGNQITSADTNGIVRITEVSPCDVLFTLPETALPMLMQALKQKGASLPVQAWDREQRTILANGMLLSLDNEIDRETGTVRLKARFENSERTLYPNQFVNARIRVTVLKDALTVPAAAIQVGARGRYVYVFREEIPTENTTLQSMEAKPKQASLDSPPKERVRPKMGVVEMRTVDVSLETPRLVVITKGVAQGEDVVIDGLDRLKDGLKVKVAASQEGSKAEPIAH